MLGDRSALDPVPQDHVELPPTPLLGTVLATQANFYWVSLDQSVECPVTLEPGQGADQPVDLVTTLLCTRRARLKKMGQHVWVGDRVRVEEPDWIDQRGAIAEVFPRKTELDRPPVANATQILLVFALAEPNLDPVQLSRFLVKAESTQLSVVLCLSKRDLLPEAEQTQWRDRIQSWGYRPILISPRTGQNLEQVHAQLTQAITVISGPSGVGKSSLINRLIPDVDLRVAKVSGKLGRGRHTTRHVELFELPCGGLLADTPGFNQPDLTCSPAELGQFFPEIRQRLSEQSCQFSDCLHRDEPGCVVRGDWERYDYYLDFLEDAIAYQTVQDRTSNAESKVKVKSGDEGKLNYEPKLAQKKYRRPSRRSQRQSLQDLRYHISDLAAADEDER